MGRFRDELGLTFGFNGSRAGLSKSTVVVLRTWQYGMQSDSWKSQLASSVWVVASWARKFGGTKLLKARL